MPKKPKGTLIFKMWLKLPMLFDKVLVAYYSRSGVTEAVAKSIAKQLGADIEKVEDKKDRSGIIGMLRSGKDVFLNKLSDINIPLHDPQQYGLVIIGTPVWGGTVSLPIKAYITRLRHRFNNVAFFCTSGGLGAKNTIKDMAYLCGKHPISTMCISHFSYFSGSYKRSISKFISELKANP